MPTGLTAELLRQGCDEKEVFVKGSAEADQEIGCPDAALVGARATSHNEHVDEITGGRRRDADAFTRQGRSHSRGNGVEF